MIYIIKSFFKDIRKNFSQISTISIIIAIGVAFFIGLSSAYDTLNTSISNYYETSNLSDVYATGNGISTTTSSIKKLKEIKSIENRIQILGQYHDSDLVINSNTHKINKVSLLEGRLPKDKSSEIALDHLFMTKNHLKVGDSIKIKVLGIEKNVKISGKIQSAEFLYQIKDPSQPVPNHKTYGYAFMNKRYLENNFQLIPNQLLITINGTNKKALAKKLEIKFKNLNFVSSDKNVSYAMFKSKLKTISAMKFILPLIFCLLSVLITLVSMSRYVENQRQTLAIFKANGQPNRIIYSSVLILPTLTVILGSFIGSFLGILIFPKLLISTLTILFDFPKLNSPSIAISLGVFILLLLILENSISFLTCWKIIEEKPASLLRPKLSKTATHSILEKIPFIWDNLSLENKLVFNNIKLNKRRFIFSSIGIIFSVCLIISSIGLKFSLSDIIKTEFEVNRKYDICATLTKPQNKEALINYKLNAVKSYAPYSVVPVQIGSKSTKLNIIDNSNHSINLLNSKNESININKANGVFISEKLLSELNLKTNDNIKLSMTDTTGNTKIITAKVTGTYLSYTNQGLYTNFDYLDKKGITIPISNILVKSNDIRKTKNSLSNNPYFSTYTVKDNQKTDYTVASQSIYKMIVLMIVASALLLFTIIYNISSINIFERTRDIATEKVLGLKDSEINSLILRENLILVVLSTMIGSLLSYKFYLMLCRNLAPDDMAFPSVLNVKSFPISYILILIFLIITNLFLKPKIKKINMLESLKSVE